MKDQTKSEKELEKISKSLSMLQHHPSCECDQCISEEKFVKACKGVPLFNHPDDKR